MADEALTSSQARAIEAIVRGKRAWSKESELLAAGHSIETLTGLVETRWLAPWDLPEGRSLTLTPWAAEKLRVWTYEHWEYVTTWEKDKGDEVKPKKARRSAPDIASVLSSLAPHEIKRTRGNKKKGTLVRVQNVVEIPRWAPEPPEREPGMPKPPKIPVRLPKRVHECQLTNWMSAEWIAKDEDPVREMLDAERWVMTESLTEDGKLAVDEETGAIKTERLKILGLDVPREDPGKRRSRRRGKKRRKVGSDSGGRPAA